MNQVYLDNAATTFPKPQSVLMATTKCMEEYCGNPGRGSHVLAMEAAEKVYETREKLAEMFHADPDHAVFTLNTTYALNMAIKGIMSRGGHMLISNMEHNAVLRPAERLASENKLGYDVYKVYDRRPLGAKEILDDIISKLRRDTKLLCAIHASNICSYSLPIREIGQFCRRHGILFLVDAAQSAGHLPIDMEKDCIDLLCLPGHKGLYGPQGCGVLLMRKGLTLDTLCEGGNGVHSLEKVMGKDAPERYEAGTLCTPAIAGLSAGLDFVNAMGIHTIEAHEKKLWQQAYHSLSRIGGIMIYDRTPGSVLLFGHENLPADDLGRLLTEHGFCLRSGYHCTALAHKALGTEKCGGVRLGLGIFNTEEEIESLCRTVTAIASAL